MYIVNWFDQKTQLANSRIVQAKTLEEAFIIFCERLANDNQNVGEFCFHDYDFALSWIAEWFPTYMGFNIVKVK